MTHLSEMTCISCKVGVPPLPAAEAEDLLRLLHSDWHMKDGGTAISRRFEFKGFSKTMLFVNALAYIADQQNHHPELRVGYNYCEVTYTTHALHGISQNDFICAAKIDILL